MKKKGKTRRLLLDARPRDEDGLTLIELMMAILLIGIILAALGGSIITSLRAAASNQREVRATALHNEVIERFQGMDWDAVGLALEGGEHPWDDGVGTCANGADPSGKGGDKKDDCLQDQDPDAVVVTSNDPDLAPEETEERGEGDVTYTIETHVVFVDRDGDSTPDTKRIVTYISWPDVDGSIRVTDVSAERAPPGKAIGFVNESDDTDGDGWSDDEDNCPFVANADQTNSDDSEPVVGSDPGDACDADGDNVADTVDNCPEVPNADQADSDGDGQGDACDDGGEPDQVIINDVTVWKRNGSGTFELANKFCVDENLALSADHRITTEVANMSSYGFVDDRYEKWTSSNETSTPDVVVQVPAAFRSGGTYSQAFYDAIIEINDGEFRPGENTTVTSVATRSDYVNDTDTPYATETATLTVPIEKC